MNWLVLAFAIQLGIVTQNDVYIAPPSAIQGGLVDVASASGVISWHSPSDTVEASLRFGATFFDHIEVSQTIRSYQTSSDQFPLFDPFQVDFVTSASFFWGGFRAGVTHECDHPVLHQTSGGSPSNVLFRNTTEFFVRYETKIAF